MDTTQKPREDAAQRRPRQQSPEDARKRPQQKKRPAQQRGGAVKTADAQRGTAARPKQQRSETAAPGKRPKQAAARQAAPRKRAAAGQQRPARRAELDDVPNKKRAYGKSKPKKKPAVSSINDIFKSAAPKAGKGKSRKASRPKEPTPAVIYTQPQAFNRSRFLIQLLTVLAVVAALVMGMSVFFKVETITVTGAEVYSAWAVREASGISEGDNLLSFGNARAGAQIMANLPYVKTVRFGIKLPDTVNIIIEEEDVVYAIKDANAQWWLINSDGHVVEQTNNSRAANYTQIQGVTLDSPVANQQAVALEDIPTETMEGGAPVPVTVTGAQRLNVALQILSALEENDVVGDAASVDVTRTEDIILWYGTRYQVNLGDSTRLDYKIACMNDVILQMSDYQSGILDISFTTWPNQVGYTPFS